MPLSGIAGGATTSTFSKGLFLIFLTFGGKPIERISNNSEVAFQGTAIKFLQYHFHIFLAIIFVLSFNSPSFEEILIV